MEGEQVAKKKPERGMKSQIIRELLEKDPDAKPKEAAEKLNEFAARQNLDLTFKPQEISMAKSRLKGSTPNREPSTPTSGDNDPKLNPQAPSAEGSTGVTVDDLKKVKKLLGELGPAKLRQISAIVDFLES